jgi:hypothetical protein
MKELLTTRTCLDGEWMACSDEAIAWGGTSKEWNLSLVFSWIEFMNSAYV